MWNNIKLAVLAVGLATLAFAVPADAGGNYPGYTGGSDVPEIIRADDWQDGVRGPRNDRYDGRGEVRHDRHKRHYYHGPYRLKPWQVRQKLRRRGFHHMYFVGRWGPVYKLRATGPRGRRVFLVVSSRTGRIIDRYPVRRRAWH